MTIRASFSILLTLLTLGCNSAALKPGPHYVLGGPYRARNLWYYPKESFDLDETGLASLIEDNRQRLTTDGEVFDQTALAAAHPTLQLPAIARLTNLENGREVTVRINDRGAANPGRLVQITKRTAVLLALPPGGIARVRLRVLTVESQAAADALPGAPTLAMTAAPRAGVQVASLAPPPGVGQAAARALPADPVAALMEPTVLGPSVAVPPLRLPEVVTQTEPRAGQLKVQLDTFQEYQFAAVQRARMASAGARIIRVVHGRTTRYRVEIGPLPDVAHAESILNEALASSIPDARIVVD